MTTLYNTPADRTSSILSTALERTLRLLQDLTKRHGYAWATNEWMAARLEYTERTITRHIAHLVRSGYIATERRANKRHIRILIPPPEPDPPKRKAYVTIPKCPPADTPKCLPATTSATSTENNNSQDAMKAANPVVVALTAAGVIPPVAHRLAAENPQECRKQLEALKSGAANTGRIQNVAAWLVAAIRSQWKHREGRQVAQHAQAPRQAARPQAEEKTNSSADDDLWNALPEAEQRRIETLVRGELPTILQRSTQIIKANCLKYCPG